MSRKGREEKKIDSRMIIERLHFAEFLNDKWVKEKIEFFFKYILINLKKRKEKEKQAKPI